MQPEVLLGNFKAFANAGFDARMQFIDVNKQEEHLSNVEAQDQATKDWNNEGWDSKLIEIGNHFGHFIMASRRLSLDQEHGKPSDFILFMEPEVKILAKHLKLYCALAAKKLGPLNGYMKKRLNKRMLTRILLLYIHCVGNKRINECIVFSCG